MSDDERLHDAGRRTDPSLGSAALPLHLHLRGAFSDEYSHRILGAASSWSLHAKAAGWRRFSASMMQSKARLAEFCAEVLSGDAEHAELRPYVIDSKAFDMSARGGEQRTRDYIAAKLPESGAGLVIRPALGSSCRGVSMIVPAATHIAGTHDTPPLTTPDSLPQGPDSHRAERPREGYNFLPLCLAGTWSGTVVDASAMILNVADAATVGAAAVDRVAEFCEGGGVVISQKETYWSCARSERHGADVGAGLSSDGLATLPELKICWVYDKPLVATLKLGDPQCIVWRSDLHDDGPRDALGSDTYAPAVWNILGISEQPGEDVPHKRQFQQLVHSLCVDVAPRLLKAYYHSRTMDRAVSQWRSGFDDAARSGDERFCALRRMLHGRTDFLLAGGPGHIAAKLGEVQCSSGLTPSIIKKLWVSAQKAGILGTAAL